ncbi:hypothetical protein [Labedaea rhizosphaerae]|uniref:hypothetical protein n=1 Tax=Labedaea rhizosphaerae TaxID=598644 RepID=UPI001060C138|nr:hypothetical protein [Labedaea rhizosphaerae]
MVLVACLVLTGFLGFAGCKAATHQTYDATLTYKVVPDDSSRYRTTHFLLHRVPGHEPTPIKPADVEFLPRDQAPPGTAEGVLLRCQVHQERDTMNVAAADASETFGPCAKV